ncbi:hypothetical protein RND71_042512 [Anisodus tanguticus]|uniref:Uncharacterized protein n=1 Tax=Anisodus tanguticus TaxID=243964 RepID=A0AAE1QR35_9SOLA|nr:hypothetical protein RND71_042512 [Anisodus tanguticus]
MGCYRIGGRRDRIQNRKCGPIWNTKEIQNNGVPGKNKKKAHLTLPSGIEEMLDHYKNLDSSTRDISIGGGDGSTNVHQLLARSQGDIDRGGELSEQDQEL